VLTLRAEPRGTRKSDRNGARRRGRIPAVVYGKGVESQPISVNANELWEILRKGGTHKMIRLQGLAGGDATVLIKDFQRGVPNQEVLSVDFLQPAMGQKVHMRVPVMVVGEEDLIRRGLILEHQLHEVECECLPEHVPGAIRVDVSVMEAGEHISISGLAAPNGVQIAGPQDAVVVVVKEPTASVIPGEGQADVTTAPEAQ